MAVLINLAQNGHVCCHAVGQVSQIPAHRLGLGDTEEESLHFFLCHCSFAPVNEWEREPWYQPGQFSPAALVRSPVGAVVGLQGCASQPAPTTAGLLLELQLLAWDIFGLTFCNTASSCSLTALGAVWQKSLEADIKCLVVSRAGHSSYLLTRAWWAANGCSAWGQAGRSWWLQHFWDKFGCCCTPLHAPGCGDTSITDLLLPG